jgi:hypothetical protein
MNFVYSADLVKMSLHGQSTLQLHKKIGKKKTQKKKEALFPSVYVPRHLIYYTLAYYVVHYVPCSMHDSLEREREREREPLIGIQQQQNHCHQ